MLYELTFLLRLLFQVLLGCLDHFLLLLLALLAILITVIVATALNNAQDGEETTRSHISIWQPFMAYGFTHLALLMFLLVFAFVLLVLFLLLFLVLFLLICGGWRSAQV